MSEILQGYDDRINQTISYCLISKTENNSITKFSSEKLLISLARLGIPLVDTINVLGLVETLLREHIEKNPGDDVTTWHLRQIVFQALNRLDPTQYNLSDIEKWGNAYARRFGNPNNRISVIMDDGESEYLTFNYLTEHFIPDLVSNIMGVPFEELQNKMISNKDIQRIADEILSVIQFMHVYEIHYDTLLKMVSDIALNPPHPWMVNNIFDSSLIKYDINRATEHAQYMLSLFNEGDFPSARHRCMECLEHSCSALLAYYGVFMGAKPFYNLKRILKLPEKNPILWKKLEIRQLEGDLTILEQAYPEIQKLTDLQKILNKINKLSGAYKGDKLRELINYVNKIYRIVIEVLDHRQKVEHRISQIQQLDNLRKDDFESTIVDVFASIPNFKKTKNFFKQDQMSAYWFQHDMPAGGILYKIEPRLLVVTLYTDEPASEKDLNLALEYFEDNRHMCNTILVADNCGFNDRCQQLALTITRSNDKNVILIGVEDLQQLYSNRNRLKKLGEIILDFYDKI